MLDGGSERLIYASLESRLGERGTRPQFSCSFYGLATHNTHIPSYPTCVEVASATETVAVYPSPLSRTPRHSRSGDSFIGSGGRLSPYL
jgi:hypothetical protein